MKKAASTARYSRSIWRRYLTHKRYALHGFVFSLMTVVAIQNHAGSNLGDDSLLYAFFEDDLVIEGPLDASAYAEGEGRGGGRLAAIDGDVMTFEDPEVGFAATLTSNGNAVVGPLSPFVPEEGEASIPSSESTRKIQIYAVQPGDTIGGIAKQFNVSLETILHANGFTDGDVIKPGDHLTILPTTGVLHTVNRGDTVSELSIKYEVDANDIMGYNGINEDAKLVIGQKLVVPGGKIPARRALAQLPNSSSEGDTAPGTKDEPAPPSAPKVGEGWVWPTSTNHISQPFRRWHTGVDIDNRARPPVYAAQAGTVSYAGWLGGYGNLIIVNHSGGIETYYAHLDKMYVGKGDTVEKGESIGKMGSTGRSTGPHLHFEVRSNGRPINPMGQY